MIAALSGVSKGETRIWGRIPPRTASTVYISTVLNLSGRSLTSKKVELQAESFLK